MAGHWQWAGLLCIDCAIAAVFAGLLVYPKAGLGLEANEVFKLAARSDDSFDLVSQEAAR